MYCSCFTTCYWCPWATRVRIIVILTNFIEQNPSWEAYGHLARQEVPCVSWIPKVHHRVLMIALVPILSQMNPVHNLATYFFKIRSSIILPSTPRSSELFLLFRYVDQIVYTLSLIWSLFGEEYKLWCTLLCSLLQSHAVFLFILYCANSRSSASRVCTENADGYLNTTLLFACHVRIVFNVTSCCYRTNYICGAVLNSEFLDLTGIK